MVTIAASCVRLTVNEILSKAICMRSYADYPNGIPTRLICDLII